MSVDYPDLGFAIIHDISILKNSGKITDNQLPKFRCRTLSFLDDLCNYFMKKCPL